MSEDQAIGTAETFGVASPDPWMQGYIGHGRGEPHKAPVWLLSEDQREWLQGWREAEQATRNAKPGGH